MRLATRSLPGFFFLTVSVAAQQAQRAAPPAGSGTVSGHVTCVGSNRPARFAEVTLQTIDVKPERSPSSSPQAGPVPVENLIRKYQTGLDGTFLMPRVPPGIYYVVVEMPGYLSPIKQFTRAELQQPTPEILTRILKAVPTVTVEANHTSTVETRIERGAELSGTIRYDDGVPLGATSVNVLIKEAKDGKESWTSRGNYTRTDDIGHYRMTGLPPGEYLLKVDLSLDDVYVTSVLDEGGNTMMMSNYSLSFYSGDVAHQTDAKPMKLAAGEQHDGADLTIPLSKLHNISGTVTEQRTGHIINAARVALNFNDGTELVTTRVTGEDSTFHFSFVPEGEYTLTVTDAKDVSREELPNPPDRWGPPETKETMIRDYGTTTQPLIVHDDVTGLTLGVPAKLPRPSGTQ